MNKGKLLLWSLFICIDFLIAAGVAELWTRIFIPVDNTCYYHDPVMGDRFCPNQETYGYVEKGYSNIFRSNSQGFHDIERTKEKKKNTLRIHFYGDSLTTAEGVPIQYTIPSLVEKYINETNPRIPVEVLNMASAEDSTAAEYITYKYIGKDYSPDIVICYFMSDFQDNIIETHKRTRSPYFEITDDNSLRFIKPVPVDMSSFTEKLKRSSLLLRLLANKFYASKIYNDFLTYKDNILTKKKIKNTVQKENIIAKKTYPLTIRILSEFKKDVEANGAKFIIVDGVEFKDNISDFYTNKDLENFCRKNNMIYIPVYKEYGSLRKSDSPIKYFFSDGHPTKSGNEYLSKIITRKLLPYLGAGQ